MLRPLVGKNERVREYAMNFFFGFATLALLTSAILTLSFLNDNSKRVSKYFNTASLTVLVLGLIVNLIVGFIALVICNSLNNFLFSQLPNLIGAYQKTKVISVILLFNVIITNGTSFIAFMNDLLPEDDFQVEIYFYLASNLAIELFMLFACWFLHPDLFGRRFKNTVNRYIQNKRQNMYRV